MFNQEYMTADTAIGQSWTDLVDSRSHSLFASIAHMAMALRDFAILQQPIKYFIMFCHTSSTDDMSPSCISVLSDSTPGYASQGTAHASLQLKR